jgi:hypothetical protein
MGKNERQAYLKAIRARYRRASRQSKATIPFDAGLFRFLPGS